MKLRIFTFAILSIFLVGLVAAVTLSLSVAPSTLSKEDNTASFTVISNVSTTFDFPSSAIILDGDNNQVSLSLTNSTNLTGTFVSFDVTVDSVDEDFFLGESEITVNITETGGASELVTLTFENTFCEAGEVGDLEIRDIEFDVTGYSDDDEEWYLLDNVEVTVEVKNNGDDDDDGKDVVVEWVLYNTQTGEFVIDDDENEMDVDEDKREEWVFDFDLDVDDFDEDDGENDFIFYVKAYSDDQGEDVQCTSEATEIKVVLNQNFVVLDDVQMPSSAQPGETIEISADVWNIGDEDEDDVKVIIVNSDLGIAEEIDIGDIDQFDDDSFTFSFTIPNDANPGVYLIRFEVEDDGGDIFENDDSDESAFTRVLTVEGDGSNEPQEGSASVEILASLDSESAVPGEELTVTATIVNTGNFETTYQIVVTNYNEWATLGSVEPRSLTLAAGQSEDVIITLTPNEDASGSNEFVLQTVYEGLVTEQRISIPLQGSTSGITGSAIFDGVGDNWFIWLIVLLNVVLVVLIVTVAVRMARR